MKSWVRVTVFVGACACGAPWNAAAQHGRGGSVGSPHGQKGPMGNPPPIRPAAPSRRAGTRLPLNSWPLVVPWSGWFEPALEPENDLAAPQILVLPPPPPVSEPSSILPSQTLAQRPQAGSASSEMLRLELAPSSGQIFVDGFYAGESEEVVGASAGLKLTSGWHRLEFRSPGYETAAVNVTVVSGRPGTARIALKPIAR